MDAKKIVWKNIITRFKVPKTLISDNGLLFDSKTFQKYCSDLGVKNRYSTPAYSQSNGQAEAMNKAIVARLKKRLEGAKGGWVEELLNVLWAYRIMLRRSIGETTFSITYKIEVIIPAEIGLSSIRVSNFTSESNDANMAKQVDLLEERQEMALIRLADYQQKFAQRYDCGLVELPPYKYWEPGWDKYRKN